MTLEFPIQVKERHFFGGIPNRCNKYYILPSNWNSQSTQQNFGEQGIPKTFDTLMSKLQFLRVFLFPQQMTILTLFLQQRFTGNTIFVHIYFAQTCNNAKHKLHHFPSCMTLEILTIERAGRIF